MIVLLLTNEWLLNRRLPEPFALRKNIKRLQLTGATVCKLQYTLDI